MNPGVNAKMWYTGIPYIPMNCHFDQENDDSRSILGASRVSKSSPYHSCKNSTDFSKGHDLEEALLALQVVLQGGLGVVDGGVPQ